MAMNWPSRLTKTPAKRAFTATGDSLKVCHTPAAPGCSVALTMSLTSVILRHRAAPALCGPKPPNPARKCRFRPAQCGPGSADGQRDVVDDEGRLLLAV